jgi:hypothetical protein
LGSAAARSTPLLSACVSLLLKRNRLLKDEVTWATDFGQLSCCPSTLNNFGSTSVLACMLADPDKITGKELLATAAGES